LIGPEQICAFGLKVRLATIAPERALSITAMSS
jgi:hypothetical protein